MQNYLFNTASLNKCPNVLKMPQPKGDLVFFVVHQRQDDPTEIVAHLVKPDGLEDLKTYMMDSGLAHMFTLKNGKIFASWSKPQRCSDLDIHTLYKDLSATRSLGPRC